LQKQTLKDWIKGQGASKGVSDILLTIASSCTGIAKIVNDAPLDGLIGASSQTNVQGEVQKDLDIITNDLMVADLLTVSSVSAMVSEEIDEVIQNSNKSENANLAVCFDPLDGSSNIDNNGIIGTIFSVLELASNSKNITSSDVLSASRNQKAAGYFIYGPACLLMVSVGNKVAMFALSEKQQQFLLVDGGDVSIAKQSNEFAINMSYQRFWDSAIAKYIEQCLLGEQGKRKKNFNMRWAGSMVADVHRIFMHGGVFIYPSMDKKGSENGKLRFLYEANPMAMLVENAGGMAISNSLPIREIRATNIHQRVPVVLGSSQEVEILLNLYQNTQ